MLSPATASPFVPSSKNCCADEPPMEERLALTAIPVLVGLEPGVTETVRSVESPAATEDGLAAVVADGLVAVMRQPTVAFCGSLGLLNTKSLLLLLES